MQNTIQTNDAGGILPCGGNGGERGKFLIFALDYPMTAGAARGGWSGGAKHRPSPVLVAGEFAPQFEGDKLAGCNPTCGGKRRRKFTAFDMGTTPPTLIRRDYSLDDLRKLGADIPKIYFDELGNMRDAGDKMVMAGPRGGNISDGREYLEVIAQPKT
jgi:hypothetical protein